MKSEKIEMRLENYPAFVEASAKLAEVKARLANAKAECESLLRAIEGARDSRETLADQAQRLLSGDEGAGVDLGNLRERYARACRQVGLLQEVVRLATQQVETERGKASAVICKAARPEFSALVLAELKAGMALLAAQDARRDYWQGLHDSGVAMATMPAVSPMVRATLNDQHCVFWTRCDDAIELGYIKPDAFTPSAPAADRDSPMNHAGLRLIAAGPDGVGLVETTGDGRTRPVAGQWHATPKAAKADGWTNAA